MSSRDNPLLSMLVQYLEVQLKNGDNTLYDELQKFAAKPITTAKTPTTTPNTSAATTPSTSSYSSSQSQDDEDDGQALHSRSSSLGTQGFFDRDKTVVRIPIMRVLDWQCLAPKVSTLYTHKWKVRPNSDGKRVRKKNPDIVENELRRLVRPTLRRLVAQSDERDPRLYERYYNATLALVRKRRGNHTQNWRNECCHKELIYGGQDLYDAKFGNRWKKVKVEDKKVEPQIKVKVEPQTSDLKERENIQETPTPRTPHKPIQKRKPLIQRNSKTKKVLFPGPDEYYLDPFFEPLLADPDVSDAEDNDADADEIPKSVVVLCADCKKKIKFATSYPPSDGEFADEQDDCERRCGDCWDEYVKTKLLPQIRERRQRDRCAVVTKHKTTKSKTTKKRKLVVNDAEKEDSEQNKNKKKAKKRTKCKCGSTTHLTARSLLCPRNPKSHLYRRQEGSFFFEFPIPECPGEGLAGYFDPMTALPPPSLPHADLAPDATVNDDGKISPATNKTSPATNKPSSANDKTPPANNKTSPANNRPSACPPPSRRIAAPARRYYGNGANVLAWFESAETKETKPGWYLAHVIGRQDDLHDVYFPGCGEVLTKLPPTKLRNADSMTRTRRQTIGKTFTYSGDDTIPSGTVWKVRKVNPDMVSFMCIKLSGPGRINADSFDIGYVMRRVKIQEEEERQRGPRDYKTVAV